MFDYSVYAERIDAHGTLMSCKDAEMVADTDLNGRSDAFNPVELLLAALAACMIKGIERVIPILNFDLRGVEILLRGARQDAPPKMTGIVYEIRVDTDESDHRLELLHENIRRYGTIFNTVASAVKLEGNILRARQEKS
ncbi:MAG: OsmC family protein [Rhodospirillales bacterium]|nr:OsmC family protein [Rhodospirillales bacterium]